MIADKTTYFSEIKFELTKLWPENRAVTFVCHGHSVPAGYFKTPHVDTFNAYPHLFHVGLKALFPNAVTNVIVTAIGGENSLSGAARFDRDVLSLRPDVLTIDYALNDRRLTLEQAAAAWSSMIEKALSAKIKVILLTPTADQGANMNDGADPLNTHAEQVRRLAAQYHVGLVDSLAAFKRAISSGTDLADLMSQGNHPNRAGHELVAGEMVEWFC